MSNLPLFVALANALSGLSRSLVRSFDVHDGTDITLLAPQVVISNGPYDSHAKDGKTPVEVRAVGIRCNGKEHKDKEHGLEAHCPIAMHRMSAGILVMLPRSVRYSHQVAKHAKLLAEIEARWRQWLSGKASRYHASDTDQVAGIQGGAC